MQRESVDVVDRNDTVLKTIDRDFATNADILRVVGIFIVNEKKDILLQLRSPKSHRYPLHWDCSGGGACRSGEAYGACAHRELYEEVGIKTKLGFLGKHYIELDDGRKHFSAFFKGEYKGELTIDPNEVAEATFFSIAEIKNMINDGTKFHPECLFGLKQYFL